MEVECAFLSELDSKEIYKRLEQKVLKQEKLDDVNALRKEPESEANN